MCGPHSAGDLWSQKLLRKLLCFSRKGSASGRTTLMWNHQRFAAQRMRVLDGMPTHSQTNKTPRDPRSRLERSHEVLDLDDVILRGNPTTLPSHGLPLLLLVADIPVLLFRELSREASQLRRREKKPFRCDAADVIIPSFKATPPRLSLASFIPGGRCIGW